MDEKVGSVVRFGSQRRLWAFGGGRKSGSWGGGFFFWGSFIGESQVAVALRMERGTRLMVRGGTVVRKAEDRGLCGKGSRSFTVLKEQKEHCREKGGGPKGRQEYQTTESEGEMFGATKKGKRDPSEDLKGVRTRGEKGKIRME